MFSTRTRTTILALVASASFAASTVAPAVSQARPKTVTTKKVTMKEACDALAGTIPILTFVVERWISRRYIDPALSAAPAVTTAQAAVTR